MAELRLSTREEIEDLVRGFTFYATGGGGLPENGKESLQSVLDQGKEIVLSDANEIDDKDMTCCPFLMGSISPHTDEVKKEMAGFGFVELVNKEKDTMRKCVEELEYYTGTQIDFIIPIELAGANTSAAIAAAHALGKKVVNGDYTGRAIPEIQQTTPYLHNKKITPISSVDSWGNVCIIKEATNYRVAERLGKLISVGSYGLAGQAGFLLQGKECKDVLIKNTLSESFELGRLIRESYSKGLNPIEETLKFLGGQRVFAGTIRKKEDKDHIGYYWGTYTIEGIDEYKGKSGKVWFKNENHMCWVDDKPVITSPDIIVMVDSKTGEPIPNPLSVVDQEVMILGFPARKEFKIQKGIDILGPRYFGFDVDYVPFEV